MAVFDGKVNSGLFGREKWSFTEYLHPPFKLLAINIDSYVFYF